MRQEARFFKAMAKYVAKHRTGELEILGTTAAIASAATGVGALADVALIGDVATTGVVSTATGLVSAGADVPSCVGGSGAACAGVVLGALGGAAGATGNFIDSGSRALAAAGSAVPFGRTAASGILATKALGFGLSDLTWDSVNH